MNDPSSLAASPRARGRFAPSPTGALHFGSLIAAVASYADARSRGGQWLVRIEDLDALREVPGAADQILRALDAFGFEWDGPVRFQSRGGELYRAALEQLASRTLLYPCACTRSEIERSARHGIEGPVYPGTCRRGLPTGRSPRAWRVRAREDVIELADETFGARVQNVAYEVGDFVVRRADGFIAYQLAVVVDDADQGITRVVRGADLLDSSQRQIMLQQMLGLPTPAYRHVPLAVDIHGHKLSKQNLAPALDPRQACGALIAALEFLQQAPPHEIRNAPPRQILAWAIAHWNGRAIPCVRAVPCASFAPAPEIPSSHEQ